MTVYQLSGFRKWLKSLKDLIAKEAILKRIERAEQGNLGDHKSVGNGVYEMRVFVGKGYRVYFTQQNGVTYWLLCGGDKSTQQTDIEKAKAICQLLKPTLK
ncbi:type II toxin-antitoxin system RelE/ParE family toxin [Necropsobacter rosorum]|uniref:type II toxin-antitoxin system RelE/ParE family toxin n=1 Tax=Necropsobacter rosorum TaxID=908285 RepID=UPI0005098BCC